MSLTENATRLTKMNQFPRLTPRTFPPVEKAGRFDPGSVYQTRLDAIEGVAIIKVATAESRDVRNMVVLDDCVVVGGKG